MNAIELIDAVVEDHASFKRVGPKLEAMPPDEAAAKRLIRAYKSESVPPWLTAYLLGCVGHAAGYKTAKQILLDNPGLSAESYAGVALAKIRGTEAYRDLKTIIFDDERPKVRRGAAHGLAHRRESDVIPVFIDAFRTKRLPHNDVSWHIAQCGPDDSTLVSLLSNSDGREQKLGCAIADILLWSDGGFTPPGRAVARCAYSLLCRDSLAFNKRMFERLSNWAAANR